MDEHRAANNSLPSVVVPAARVEDVVITESAGEVLVYDKLRHQIHHLNRTAAVIWRLCDGSRSVHDVAIAAGVELGAGVDTGVVRIALARLADANLFADSASSNPRGVPRSRRALLRGAAVASAVALPAIVSMTAPSKGQAAGCFSADPFGPWSCSLAPNPQFPGCSVTCCCSTNIGIGAAICVRNGVLKTDTCTCAAGCVSI